MAEDGVLYGKSGAVATITLNRPEKYNTIRVEMALAIDEMLSAANRDNEVRVIVLEGAGDSFCAGFDFSNGLEHHQVFKEDGYDPGMDVFTSANSFIGRIPIYMGDVARPEAHNRQGTRLVSWRGVRDGTLRGPRHRLA